ncbi:MAG: hypothetical protein PWQ37_608 [Candidatus Petromonas sp.]|jgi:diguanylate cyclase (GGDEF)-like protein|nr:hypothetical protein [Candidatus Petromonas sp.]
MERNKECIKILLVEDNLLYVRIINDMLTEYQNIEFLITHVELLKDALNMIDKKKFDVILLDLILPDSQGFDTFRKIKKSSEGIPIILLTGVSDESIALKAVKEGAQDYLNKSEVSPGILTRAIRYSIERQQLLIKLKEKSILDDLTGLYNRRGFFTSAQREIKRSKRSNKGFSLVFIDLDGLKWINDNLGHAQGDNAIIDTANVLKSTFRESDIIGRIGGDEFVVITLDTDCESSELILKRLERAIKRHNSRSNRPYKLSISAGVVYYDPKDEITLDELLSRADKIMYKSKEEKKKVEKFQRF